MPGHQRVRGDKGQELIEFALVLPLLLLLLLGIAEFGIAIFRYNTIANAAREGARCGIIDPLGTRNVCVIEDAARDLADTAGLDPGAIAVASQYFPATLLIRVTVTYEHHLITGPIIAAVGGSTTIPLQAVAQMRVEQIP